MKIHFLFLYLFFLSLALYSVDMELMMQSEYFQGIEPSEEDFNYFWDIYAFMKLSGYHDNSGLEWHLTAQYAAYPLEEDRLLDWRYILDEAYLFLPLGSIDISLGQKYANYGFTDVFSPLNCVNAQITNQYSLDASYLKDLPNPMLHLQYYPSFEDVVELIYIPVSRPDQYSGGQVFLNKGNLNNLSVSMESPAYITESLHNIYFIYNRYSEKADFQFLYGWYMDQTAYFDLDGLSNTGGILNGEIDRSYQRKQTIGAAYSTNIGNFAFSQDLAVNWTENLDGTKAGWRKSDISANSQIQTSLFGGYLTQVTMVYQYLVGYDNEENLDEDLQEEFYSYYQQPVPHILFFVGHVEKMYLRDKMKAQLNVGFFFSPDIYIAPRLSYNIKDNLICETGADITLGDPGNLLLKQNAINDNFFFRLKYHY